MQQKNESKALGRTSDAINGKTGGTLQNFTRSCCLLEFLTSCFRASCSLDKNGIPKRSLPMLVKNFLSESRNGKIRHLRQIATVLSL